MVAGVSVSVSLLSTDDVEADILITSAPTRLHARLKLVRVASSMNGLIRLRPRLAAPVERHVAFCPVDQLVIADGFSPSIARERF